MPNTQTNAVIEFLRCRGVDHRGFTVEHYLQFSEQRLEDDHQWVQWAFPIDTVSVHNPHAPTIELADRRYFKCNCHAYDYQSRLVKLYLESIGAHYDKYNNIDIDFAKFSNVITDKNNHHMKRISRLLRHLMMTNRLYLPNSILYALTRDCISVNPNLFTPWTIAYWYSIVYSDHLILH